jgi:hypothetical protein
MLLPNITAKELPMAEEKITVIANVVKQPHM